MESKANGTREKDRKRERVRERERAAFVGSKPFDGYTEEPHNSVIAVWERFPH